jgi:hypothetical protein
MRRKLSLQIILSLALLFAQLGAVAHAYSHSNPDQIGQSHQTQLCGQCQSGTPLLAAAGCPAQLFTLHAPDTCAVSSASSVSLIEAGPRHSFQSRAPPYLL